MARQAHRLTVCPFSHPVLVPPVRSTAQAKARPYCPGAQELPPPPPQQHTHACKRSLLLQGPCGVPGWINDRNWRRRHHAPEGLDLGPWSSDCLSTLRRRAGDGGTSTLWRVVAGAPLLLSKLARRVASTDFRSMDFLLEQNGVEGHSRGDGCAETAGGQAPHDTRSGT